MLKRLGCDSQSQRQLQLSLEAHGRYISTLIERQGLRGRLSEISGGAGGLNPLAALSALGVSMPMASHAQLASPHSPHAGLQVWTCPPQVSTSSLPENDLVLSRRLTENQILRVIDLHCPRTPLLGGPLSLLPNSSLAPRLRKGGWGGGGGGGTAHHIKSRYMH